MDDKRQRKRLQAMAWLVNLCANKTIQLFSSYCFYLMLFSETVLVVAILYGTTHDIHAMSMVTLVICLLFAGTKLFLYATPRVVMQICRREMQECTQMLVQVSEQLEKLKDLIDERSHEYEKINRK